MNFTTKKIIVGAIFVVAVLMAVCYKLVPEDFRTLMLVGALAILAVGSVLRYNWLRCPHCKTPLGKFSREEVCKNCGKKLD